MKIVEIDKKLSEDIAQQPIQEGPFDWMLRSSRIGQWLAQRDGKKAQQEMATMYIKALSAWRGFQGAKQLNADLLTKWMTDSQRNFGLGLPSNEIQEILADPNVQKSLVTRNPQGVLDNAGIKNFIIALSRANFQEVQQTAQANPKLAQTPSTDPLSKAAQQTTGAGASAATRVGITAPAQSPAGQTSTTSPATQEPDNWVRQAAGGGSAISTGANQAQSPSSTAQQTQQAQQDSTTIQNSIKALPAAELAIVKKMLQARLKAPAESIEEVSPSGIGRAVGRGIGAVGGAVAGAGTAVSRGLSKGYQSARDAFAGGELDFEEVKEKIVDLTPEQAKALMDYIQKLETVRKNVVKPVAKKSKTPPARSEPTVPQEPTMGEPELRVEPGGKPSAPKVWRNPRTGQTSSVAPGRRK
jgi:hypothetical protein